MTRSVKVRPSWLNRDGVIMLLAMLVLFFVWTNNSLERWRSYSCLALRGLHRLVLLKREAIRQEESRMLVNMRYETRIEFWHNLIMIFVGLGFAVYAANILVEQAYDRASSGGPTLCCRDHGL